jgi:Mg2+ and Co2+ transporter CorA
MSQRGLHVSLELVRHFSQMKPRPSSSLTQHKLKTPEAEYSAIGTDLRCVQQILEALILSAETYQARMSNQLTLIPSLFLQEDQSIRIDIAKASKSIALESRRDSLPMKTLAVVTMVFLLGTFIATFFAMPLFDWHASNGQVVDKRIRIYFLGHNSFDSFCLRCLVGVVHIED